MFSINMFIFILMVYLFIKIEKPFLCSSIYTVITFLLWIFGGAALAPLLIFTAIRFTLVSFYFWFLYRIERGLFYWIVLLGGAIIVVL